MKSQNSEQVASLSPEAKALYSRVAKEWAIKDGAGLATLLVACQSLDRLREAQKMLAVEGICTTDRFGQKRLHPAILAEKQSRAGLLQSLKSLNLDLESLELD